MPLKEISYLRDYSNEPLVIVKADCPRKPEGCPGEVWIAIRYSPRDKLFEDSNFQSPILRWGRKKEDNCLECGVGFALTSPMIMEVFKVAGEFYANEQAGHDEEQVKTYQPA